MTNEQENTVAEITKVKATQMSLNYLLLQTLDHGDEALVIYIKAVSNDDATGQVLGVSMVWSNYAYEP